MRILRKRIFLGLVLLLGSLSQGVDLAPQKIEYYTIDPVDLNDIIPQLNEKGPKLDRYSVHAHYTPTINILNRIFLLQQANHCQVTLKEFTLEGTTLLPQLRHDRTYEASIKEAFNHIIAALKAHELKHEAIYYKEMIALENRIEAYLEGRDYRQCESLKEDILALNDQFHIDVDRQNERLDCMDYGIATGLTQCDELADQFNKPLHKIIGKERKENAKVKYLEQNSAADACQSGELIEPFKDHFYCIN